MNAVAQLAPSSPVDPDALYALFMARAEALRKGSLSGADALVADLVLADLPVATFKSVTTTIGKATGLDAESLRKHAVEAREALSATVAKTGPHAPSGMANPGPAMHPDTLDRVLEQMSKAVQRQVMCSLHAMVAIVLWSACTYGFQGASIFPRLAITSATKRCGKSTLLGTLRVFVSKPLKADNVTASAVFRVIANRTPTLLIDEVDAFFSKNDELRGVVNAGYERSGSVLRAVPTPDGKGFTEAEFNVYCPAALAGIGGLPDTVLDRSIIVRLDRAPARANGQRQAPMRHRALEGLRALIAPHLVAHAAAIEGAMAGGLKMLPRGLSDRAQDNWEPLLTVADLAGGTWPLRARAAALALSGGHDAPSQREMLLEDLRPLVDVARAASVGAWQVWVRGGRIGTRPKPVMHIRSADFLEELLKLEHRPWPECGKDGKGLSVHRLAALLKPFNIEPEKHRMPARHAHTLNPSGTESVRAYSILTLRAAFRRYLA